MYMRRPSWSAVVIFLMALSSGYVISCLYVGLHSDKCRVKSDEQLTSEVRIMCAVTTHPETHGTRALAVRDTWGQRCSQLLFFSSQPDLILPTVMLNVSEGREHLWKKTRAALTHSWGRGYMKHNDWLLKADDDTYVVMEHLRRLLLPLDPNDALFLGLQIAPHGTRGYMSGGAGYVLSRGALSRVLGALEAPRGNGHGTPDTVYEDVNMGLWMARVGATFISAVDESGRQRFHAFPPSRELFPDPSMDGMRKNYRHRKGCCSESAVSFHYLSGAAIRALEYVLHELEVYGEGWCHPGYGAW